MKSLIYRHGGNVQDAERYNTKYLELKSDILTYKQLRNITEQGFLSQLQEISDNLRLAQEKQRRMYTIACISAILTIAISVLLILIYKKNRALREKIRAVLEGNTEIYSVDFSAQRLADAWATLSNGATSPSRASGRVSASSRALLSSAPSRQTPD